MKSELTKRLFTACMIVFLLSMSMVLFVTNSYLGRRNIAEVKDKAMFLSSVINEEGWEFLSRTEIHSAARITIVAANGSVL